MMSVEEACRAVNRESLEVDWVMGYLSRLYEGTFSSEQIDSHFQNHVMAGAASSLVRVLEKVAPPGSTVLDIGSGFGTFVAASRLRGFQSFGVEVSKAEVDYGNRRLRRIFGNSFDPGTLKCGDALDFSASGEKFDVITLWNVLEHVADLSAMFELLRTLSHSQSQVLLICPNYFSWGFEAHYGFRWNPALLFSRDLVRKRIEGMGRQSWFYENRVFPRTNWEVRRIARRFGFRCYPLPREDAATSFRRIASQYLQYLPTKPTIALHLKVAKA